LRFARFSFIALAVVLFATWGYLFLSRMEKSTSIQFPQTFLTTEKYCGDKTIRVLSFVPREVDKLLIALNSLEECTRIELGRGEFLLNTSLTVNNVNGIEIRGAGKNLTTVRFKDAGNVNGIDVEASHSFTIRDLRILDSPKNGLEIRLSENVVIDNLEVTWSTRSGEAMSQNGAYGVYPVNVVNLLLQNTDSYYASDAGLYVGQCINALVRYNRAEYNVMGLEIENTINAEVYENVVRNNTGGFLAYDHHKNSIVSRNIRVFKNTITNNNNPNFASSGIVKTVPAGVGMVLTAVRDIEIYENTFANNNTADIGILNGLVSETPDFSQWKMNNWRSHDIYIHSNVFNGGSGNSVDNGNTSETDRPLGVLLDRVIQTMNELRVEKGESRLPVPNIVYDGVDKGYTILTLTSWFGKSKGNYNAICLKNNDRGKMSPKLLDLNLPALLDNSDEPTSESIRKSIEKGDTLLYTAEDEYGGLPPGGFSCEGYRFKGMPLDLSIGD